MGSQGGFLGVLWLWGALKGQAASPRGQEGMWSVGLAQIKAWRQERALVCWVTMVL